MLRADIKDVGILGVYAEKNDDNGFLAVEEFRKKIEEDYKTASEKVEEIKEEKKKDPKVCVKEKLEEIYKIVSKWPYEYGERIKNRESSKWEERIELYLLYNKLGCEIYLQLLGIENIAINEEDKDSLKKGIELFLCAEDLVLGLANYSGNNEYKKELEEVYTKLKINGKV